MKQIIFLLVLNFGYGVLQAQSLEQGNQYLYYERYESAENSFHQILNNDRDNDEAWLGLAQAYLLQDEADKLADSIKLAPSSIQSEPYYKVARGAFLLQKNNASEANNYFQQALTDTKEKNVGVLSVIAKAHIIAKAGNADYAIALINKAIKRDKKNAALYVLLGDAYRKLNNGTEAFKAYQQAIDKDDKYAEAYHKIGEIFLTQKNSRLYTEYFKKAIAADPNYAPSLYQLYVYAFYHDPAKAMDYYKQFISKSDPSLQNEYDMADLLYLNKQYHQAIKKASALVQSQGDKVQPRLYKLLSYSYAGNKDTAQAISYMQQYFAKEADSNFIIKDFEAMSDFYLSMPAQDSLAAVYLERGVALEKDTTAQYTYYKKLADMAKERKDYAAQAEWLGKYNTGNEKASNLDLFYWGIAHYRVENYPMADSIFGIYISKYPEQGFGYYWQAKSKALMDKDMTEGLAIPVYQKLIEVLQKDTANENSKKWAAEAYGYLAAYEVNTKKDFARAIDYFEKVLEMDPENESAKKYIGILEKDLAKQK
jgi:tetratricopeptide (TPR) repeat protein